MIKKLLWALIYLPSLGYGQSIPYAKELNEFDHYVEQARKEWQVPGLAIGVVKDGKVIFKKGYGVRMLGQRDAIDTQTLFPCASTTKAMTAACMGMLVDEGKVKWSDPVVNYLPDFLLYDPYVTRELKVRDLFIHDSGVGEADFLWTSTTLSSDEIIKKMRLVKPSYSIRSGFAYQNLFYLVAGKVIEKVSGQPWEQFIQKRLFEPLGMNRTFARQADVTDPNQAKATMMVDGTLMTIDHSNADPIAPAGAVWSCIDDISKWALCMLDTGRFPGGRLVKASTWRELFRPQAIIPVGDFFKTAQLTKPNWTTYGLGWYQHDYKGKKVNLHTGSLNGAVAIHAQLPEANIAVFMFGNLDHSEVRHPLIYKAFDLFSLGGSRDWSSEMLKLYNQGYENAAQKQKEFELHRILNTTPSLPLTNYAGKYTDPLYGELEVMVSEKNLFITVNHLRKATVAHFNFDTFYGPYEKAWYGKAKAVFSINAAGDVERINFDGREYTKELPKN